MLPVDLRDTSGAPVDGYVAVSESASGDSPVHQQFSYGPGPALVVDLAVMDTLLAHDLVGIRLVEESGPFPGDDPVEGLDF